MPSLGKTPIKRPTRPFRVYMGMHAPWDGAISLHPAYLACPATEKARKQPGPSPETVVAWRALQRNLNSFSKMLAWPGLKSRRWLCGYGRKWNEN